MQTSREHQAEAERLIRIARSGDGADGDDPRDPVVALRLAAIHAQLACVPGEDVVEGEVVADEAEELLARARVLLAQRVTGFTALALIDELILALAARRGHTTLLSPDAMATALDRQTKWTRSQWLDVFGIAHATYDAVVLTKEQLVGLHSTLVKTSPTPASHTEALEKATDVVEGWLGGFPR